MKKELYTREENEIYYLVIIITFVAILAFVLVAVKYNRTAKDKCDTINLSLTDWKMTSE